MAQLFVFVQIWKMMPGPETLAVEATEFAHLFLVKTFTASKVLNNA
jgi:hypothetical protein